MTLSVTIDCDHKKLYKYVFDLKNLSKWATTFAKSIKKVKGAWILETARGPVNIRMAPKNTFGVLDHYIYSAPGVEIYVPMRVVANGPRCEVLFTLFQQLGMSDENYEQDIAFVRADLKNLQAMMERP